MYFIPRSRSIISLAVTLAAIARPAAADDVVSFQEALRLTATRNPTLVANQYAERIADAELEQAGLRPDPTLEVSLENFAGSGSFRGTSGLEATVQASQTIERGGKRGKRIAAAASLQGVARTEIALQRRQALAATAAAYLEAALAESRSSQSSAPIEIAQRLLEDAESRLATAMGSGIDVARAKAALATARIEQVRRGADATAALIALSSHWGAPETKPSISGKIAVPSELPSRHTLEARLDAHPALALGQARIEAAKSELAVRQVARIPDVDVGAGVRWLRPDDDAALVASVSIPLPTQRRNLGAIRAGRERVAQAEHAARIAENELRLQFAAAWKNLETAHQLARQLRADPLRALEEAASALQEAFSRGQAPLSDVLAAQHALRDLRGEVLEADFAYATALLRVESLVDEEFTLTRQLFSE